MRHYCLAAVCVAMAGSWCGCARTEQANLAPESDPYLSQGRVQFESHTTDAIVKVVRIDPVRDETTGLLKVILTLRNVTKSNLWIDIRTTFLDDRQHVLEQTNWEPIELNARTVTEYTCASISPKAADYQIIIRKPNKTSYQKP